MAAFSGKSGTITWAGTGTDCETNVQSWSIEVNVDISEVTSMSDTWKSYVSGIKDWTATVECLVDDTAVPNITNIAENASLALSDGNNTFEGDAICINLSPSTSVDGVPSITFNFQGNDSSGISVS